MSEDKAKIRAELEGVSEVAAGAKRVGDSLETAGTRAARTVGGGLKAITGGLAQVVSTGLSAAGVLGAINVAKGVEDVRHLGEQTAKLGRTAGVSGEQLRKGFDQAEKKTLTSSMAMADFARTLGRATLSGKGAIEAIGGLGDEALATGQDLSEQLDIGKTLMAGVGATGDLTGELGRLRHMAESLGLAGGPQALKDTIVAIGPALQGVAVTSDAARAKLEAFVAVSSKGLKPEQQKVAAAGLLSFLKGQATNIRHSTGVDILDRYSQIEDPTAALALYKRMANTKFGKDQRRKFEATVAQGGEDNARLIWRMDVGEVQRIAALGDEGKTAKEAEAARQSQEGKRTALQLSKDQARRGVGGALLGVQDGLVNAVGAPAATVLELGGANLALKGAGVAGKAALGAVGGTALAAGALAAAGAAAQLGVMSGLGEDRKEMGDKWRRAHASTIGRDLAGQVVARGAMSEGIFQRAAQDGAVVELLKSLDARQAELNETLRTQVAAGLAAELRKNPPIVKMPGNPNQSGGN